MSSINLAKLQGYIETQSSTDASYKSYQWKPPVGESKIRFVPSPHTDACITPIEITYGVTRFPIVSLRTFGKQDPIQEYVYKLLDRGSDLDKELVRIIGYKTRYFVPIIVRGEESLGVRILDFPYPVMKVVVADTKRAGNFIDPKEGRDYLVTKEKGFRKSIELKLDLNLSPLSEDPKEVALWQSTQPNPITFFKEYTYDEIRGHLKTYLKETWPGVKAELLENASKEKGDSGVLFEGSVNKSVNKPVSESIPAASVPVAEGAKSSEALFEAPDKVTDNAEIEEEDFPF